MIHVLIVDHHVVLSSHVISNVMIHDETEESVKQGQINLLIELLECALHHDVTLTIARLPDVLQNDFIKV